ncbi:hypothetical protein SC499_09140 [Peribacillus simplex]|uniref:hypothetical protein n=1 Tax=Peribacillus simplex TaxID=1478 RepID=UPI00298E5F59|nr:hypothetical protein [Peribacillus simplex]MDW7614891.1 hypothetical protein [Peribacillus simplex]
MPTWFWIHGILLVIWIVIWGAIYYLQLWRLSFPFEKMTSFKIVLSLFLPFSWLSSSFLIGIIYSLIGDFVFLDKVLVIFIPLIILIVMFIYYFINSSIYHKNENQIQTSIKNLKENCQKWILQFPFISEEQYDLQIFISKDRPVGRMIIYELTCNEERVLKEQTGDLPKEVTLLFVKK